MKGILAAFPGAVALCLSGSVSGQYLMMPDSTNNRIVLFDPVNGSVVNSNYFGLAGGTPVHAMQVGQQIWVSTQIGDRIDRFDLAGNALGSITGGMDNLRGMELVNGTVYVANDGTGNGAPGPSLRMFDTAGTDLGFFATTSTSGPFGILDYEGGLLVSSDTANDDVHEYSFTGTSLGAFHNSTGLNFAEQMNYDSTGNILVAGFSTNNVATLNYNTGAIVSSFAAPGARGVWQLGNGNVLWTSGSGAHVFDVTLGTSTQVYAGGGRFIDFLNIPSPGAATLLGLTAAFGVRRRRA